MVSRLSDTIEKGDHPSQIWFIWFRIEDLNIPNLHNQYKSNKRKNSQKKQNIC